MHAYTLLYRYIIKMYVYNPDKLKSIAYVNGNCDARQIQRDYCYCKRTRFDINNTTTFFILTKDTLTRLHILKHCGMSVSLSLIHYTSFSYR